MRILRHEILERYLTTRGMQVLALIARKAERGHRETCTYGIGLLISTVILKTSISLKYDKLKVVSGCIVRLA